MTSNNNNINNMGVMGQFNNQQQYQQQQQQQQQYQVQNPQLQDPNNPIQQQQQQQNMNNFVSNNNPMQQVQVPMLSGGGVTVAPSPQNQIQQTPQPIPIQQQQQSKELNAASLCRLGQETVQEIISRTQELFQLLRAAQPPDGKFPPGMDRKPKFQETLKTIKANFKRLKVICEKLEESFPTGKTVHFEADILQKSESDIFQLSPDDTRNTESYRLALEEYKEIMENVTLRNRHLKETIDHLRYFVWDVNTMLSMRKE